MLALNGSGNTKMRALARSAALWGPVCGVFGVLVLLAGCPVVGPVACDSATPCADDGNFCNGTESCGSDGFCASSNDACAAGETCDEANDSCAPSCTTDADCDDGDPCNGDETCDATTGCVAGTDLVCTPPDACSTSACNPADGMCDDTPVTCAVGETCDPADGCVAITCSSSSECDNGVFCDGAETCDVASGACSAGTAPCGDNGLFCDGAESCDEATNACSSSGDPCPAGETCVEADDSCTTVVTCAVDADCTDDGLFCNGAETCVSLVCTSGGDPCSAFETCNETTDACDTVITPGANVVLTTAIDIGPDGVTTGDDTVTGTFDGGATSTINLGDQVDPLAGNNTFNVISSASPIPSIDVVNTQTIQVRSTTAATTWDVSNIIGATHMVYNNGSSDLTLDKIQNSVTLGVNGGNGVEDFHAQFKDTVVNTGADAVTVDLNGADLAIFDVQGATVTEGFEDITFNVTGDNEISELTSGDNDLKNVFVTGGSSLVLGNTTAVADATKFDANGLTGDLDVSVAAGNTTCIGGSGNDRFNFAATLGAGDSVDGNAGDNTLAISQNVTGAGALATAVAAALQIKYLEVTHASSIVDMDFVGTIATIVASGASSTVNIDGSTDSDSVKVIASKTTLDIDEKTDTLSNVANVELNGKAFVALSTALDATDHETVNITSEGVDGNSVANVIKNAGGTVNVFGSKNLTITAIGTSAIVKAGTFGGKLTVTGSGAVDDMTGSPQDDTMAGGVGSDTLAGGGGANTFSMVVADVPDTITDYAPGVDFFDWNTALKSIDAVTTAPADVNAFQSATAGTAILAATGIFELTGTTVATQTAANVVTALGTTATNGSIAAADKLLFVVYTTGGGAAVWEFTGAGANVTAGELTLAATLNLVAADSLSASDFK